MTKYTTAKSSPRDSGLAGPERRRPRSRGPRAAEGGRAAGRGGCNRRDRGSRPVPRASGSCRGAAAAAPAPPGPGTTRPGGRGAGGDGLVAVVGPQTLPLPLSLPLSQPLWGEPRYRWARNGSRRAATGRCSPVPGPGCPRMAASGQPGGGEADSVPSAAPTRGFRWQRGAVPSRQAFGKLGMGCQV